MTAADNYSLSLIDLQSSQAGQYYCKVTNAGVSTNTNPTAVQIIAGPPSSSDGSNGGMVYFRYNIGYGGPDAIPEMDGLLLIAAPRGSSPFRYQWSYGGTAIPGATDQILQTSLHVPSGPFSVAVMNGQSTTNFEIMNGFSVSRHSPFQHQAPRPTSIRTGERLVMHGEAYGSPTIHYQWSKDGVPIVGATSMDYVVESADLEDGGVYSITASNAYGSLTLPPARVVVAATDLSRLRSSGLTTQDLSAVTFGAGQFVAVGAHGAIVTSTDGISWINRTKATSSDLKSVVCGGGVFVAVGDHGTILTSPQGTAWTVLRAVTNENYSAVAYQLGKFVVVGSRGTILSASANLIWTVCNTGQSAADYSYVTGGSGRFIAGNSKFLTISDDAVNWRHTSPPDPSSLISSICYSSDRFEFFPYARERSYRSADGLAWLSLDSQTPGDVTDFAIYKGRRLFIGDGLLRSQPVGEIFIDDAIPTGGKVNAICASSSMAVVVGDGGRILTSVDGVSWTIRNEPPYDTGSAEINCIEKLANGNSIALPVGTGYAGPLFTSSDSINWSQSLSGSRPDYVGNLYAVDGSVSVLDGNLQILKTVDGQNWTRVPASAHVVPMTYGKQRYVNFAYGVQYSSDGIIWHEGDKSAVSSAWSDGRAAAYGNGYFVAVEANGFIARSSDGITWTSVTQTSAGFRDVIFADGRFLAVGLKRDDGDSAMYLSIDGLTWQELPSIGIGAVNRIRFIGNQFYIPTSFGAILSSFDGVNWTAEYVNSYYLNDVGETEGNLTAVGRYGAILTVNGGASSDFNHDRQPDILWQNTNTGERFVWTMNGVTHWGGISLGTVETAWSIAATADFNNDGYEDVLWQNTSTGERYIWFMNGTGHIGGASLGIVATAWSIAGTADFNGDGQTDILWQNTGTGKRYLWLMRGAGHLSDVSLGVVNTQWSIAALADFNDDGQTDILWQNTSTGERYIWFMNGAGHLSDASLGIVNPQWSIAAAADFNGDGHPDILWQNTVTGQRYLWLMNGTAHQSDIDLGIVDENWKMVK